jgi:1-aminocyclopropane-1-carboxylate deaminase/D-cysteine desulfhydrase-like pyridoxal-dependent ACC family enzyme
MDHHAAMTPLPLFERYPQLASAHPVAGLLQGPTPVEPFAGAGGVFLKRDDLTATDYGGNKIRKLDFLLADARARGRKTVLTFGYAGSNFVAATAWHGAKLGLKTIAGLLPQVPADYIVDNLSVALAAGAQLFVREREPALIASALARSLGATLRDRAPPVWIPPGGSNALGALGFVNAALELQAQVESGTLPAPRSIVLPFSSMGTVAGIAAGLSLAKLPARITAVQVVGEKHAGRDALAALTANLAALLRRHGVRVDVDAMLSRVDIRTEFYGGTYAQADATTHAAMDRFAEATGARADSAYSGKALACLYADLASGRLQAPALYWHTLSASVRPPGVARAARESVPAELRRYW